LGTPPRVSSSVGDIAKLSRASQIFRIRSTAGESQTNCRGTFLRCAASRARLRTRTPAQPRKLSSLRSMIKPCTRHVSYRWTLSSSVEALKMSSSPATMITRTPGGGSSTVSRTIVPGATADGGCGALGSSQPKPHRQDVAQQHPRAAPIVGDENRVHELAHHRGPRPRPDSSNDTGGPHRP